VCGDARLREALEQLRSYNVDIAAGRINYRPQDHIDVIDRALLSQHEPQRGETSPAQEQPAGDAFDFRAHLQRQRDWSCKTFGPGARTAGVIDHIRKELREIEADPADVSEWIDVAILALDGAWRAGSSPDDIIGALVAKQTKNETRVWPDWLTMPADKAIEHDRSKDSQPAVSAPVSALARRVVSHLDDGSLDTSRLPGTMGDDLRALRECLARRQSALRTDDHPPSSETAGAWANSSNPDDVISNARKNRLSENNGSPGKTLAALFSIPLFHHPAPMAPQPSESDARDAAPKCQRCNGSGEYCLGGRSAHPSNWRKCEDCAAIAGRTGKGEGQ
jgi:hypothetical protein